MKSREKVSKTINPRDRKLFYLLILVKEFQRDIVDLRKKFNIPLHGYETDVEAHKRIGSSSQRADEQLGVFGDFAPGIEQPPASAFQNEIIKISQKFSLPYNFYNMIYTGVAWYALRDEIHLIDRNWQLVYDLSNPRRWMGIRVFSPMSKKQIKMAISDLNQEMLKLLPSPINTKIRTNEKLERDILVLEKLAKRTEIPVRKKNYIEGSYLSLLSKQEISTKKRHELEKKHKRSIKIGYSQKTWKQAVAMRADSLKASKKRLNKLAISVFGFPIEE